MANRAKLYQECPTLAIEDALRRVRANDSFKPNASHAADLQHAMAALGYCDHFVTRDGQTSRSRPRLASNAACSSPETTRLLAEVPQAEAIREKLAEPLLFQHWNELTERAIWIASDGSHVAPPLAMISRRTAISISLSSSTPVLR